MTSKPNLQTLHIAPAHGNLASTLTRFLRKEGVAGLYDDPSLVEERDFVDFGVKYKLLVRQHPNPCSSSSPLQIKLQVTIPGWTSIRREALTELQSIYGNAVVDGSQTKNPDAFDFGIRVHELVPKFDSSEECAVRLAQLRVQAAGAPISQALAKLLSTENIDLAAGIDETVHQLATHPKCGTCHCFGTFEK
jgi:hypothetical protein